MHITITNYNIHLWSTIYLIQLTPTKINGRIGNDALENNEFLYKCSWKFQGALVNNIDGDRNVDILITIKWRCKCNCWMQ